MPDHPMAVALRQRSLADLYCSIPAWKPPILHRAFTAGFRGDVLEHVAKRLSRI